MPAVPLFTAGTFPTDVVMNRDQPNPERLVDELAVALCGLLSLDDETRCILMLIEHGFRAAEINAHFDEAMALARMARADGWHEPAQVTHA
jgi:hypothetical protein